MLVSLADTELGRERLVRARYVVGADGIRSTVRDALGIEVESSGSLGERLAVLMRGPLWDVAGEENRYTIYFTPLDREPFFLPVGKPDRWVYGSTWDFGADPLETISEARVRELVLEAAGVREPGAGDRARSARHLRGGPRGALQGRSRIPDRRRCAPGNPAWRDGHEQRDPRRLRPGLEDFVGPQGVGRRFAARHLRVGASPGRGAQRSPVVGSCVEPCAARMPRSIRSSAGGSDISG